MTLYAVSAAMIIQWAVQHVRRRRAFREMAREFGIEDGPYGLKRQAKWWGKF